MNLRRPSIYEVKSTFFCECGVCWCGSYVRNAGDGHAVIIMQDGQFATISIDEDGLCAYQLSFLLVVVEHHIGQSITFRGSRSQEQLHHEILISLWVHYRSIAKICAGGNDNFAVLQWSLHPYLRAFRAESLNVEVGAVSLVSSIEACIAICHIILGARGLFSSLYLPLFLVQVVGRSDGYERWQGAFFLLSDSGAVHIPFNDVKC